MNYLIHYLLVYSIIKMCKTMGREITGLLIFIFFVVRITLYFKIELDNVFNICSEIISFVFIIIILIIRPKILCHILKLDKKICRLIYVSLFCVLYYIASIKSMILYPRESSYAASLICSILTCFAIITYMFFGAFPSKNILEPSKIDEVIKTNDSDHENSAEDLSEIAIE